MRLSELRRSEREQASVPDKFAEVGHPAAAEFLKNQDLSQYAVTMTSIPKVGINPQSRHDTPVGIYFYPAHYYLSQTHSDRTLPFQHHEKYINILQFKTNKILYLNTQTSQDFDRVMQQLKNLNLGQNQAQQYQYQQLLQDLIQKSKTQAAVPTPGGEIWFVLYRLSDFVSKTIYRKPSRPPRITGHYVPPSGSALVWNWLLRKLGIQIVIDQGQGIIHVNEPTQGMIVNPVGTFEVVKRLNNLPLSKISDKTMATQLNRPGVTDEERIAAIQQKNPRLLLKMRNPSESVKLAAVLTDPWLLTYISNPSRAIQKSAVEQLPRQALLILKKKQILVPEELQKLAVSLEPDSIQEIDEPSEAVQQIAIQQAPGLISLIPNATRPMKELAVKLSSYTIKDIPDADFDLKMLAVRHHPYSILGLKYSNPQEKFKLELIAVKGNPYIIIQLKNPAVRVQEAAVTQDGLLIQKLKNPKEPVQKAAVIQNPKAFHHIVNPTPAVQALYQQLTAK